MKRMLTTAALWVTLVGLGAARPEPYEVWTDPPAETVQQQIQGKWSKPLERRGNRVLLDLEGHRADAPVVLRLRTFGYEEATFSSTAAELERHRRIPPNLTQALALNPIHKTVQFQTRPGDVEIYLQEPGHEGSQGLQFLGRSGQPQVLDVSWFGSPLGTLEFHFVAPGYQNVTATLDYKQFQALPADPVVWPDPALVLPATGHGLGPTLAYAHQNPALALSALGLVVIAVYAGSSGLSRRYRALRVAEHRQRQLEAVRNPTDPLLGQCLGSYYILERLGQGGMGKVYRGVPADSPELDATQSLAVKVIDPQAFAGSAEFRLRFRREVEIMKRLSHPNIVRLFEVGEQESVYYVVMELIAGQSLENLLQPEGMPIDQALTYLRQLFAGVSYAHSQGIVHRDLKPENVLLTDKGVLKVVDFGLARAHDAPSVTVSGQFFGTPAYVPPEQITEIKSAEPRSDQYSLGVVVFQMLTGRLPFQDTDPMNLIMKHLSAPPPAATELRADLPVAVDAVLARMLAKKPEERYRDLHLCRQALEDALGNRP